MKKGVFLACFFFGHLDVVDCTSALPSPFWGSRSSVLTGPFASASNCHIGSVDYDNLEEPFSIKVYDNKPQGGGCFDLLLHILLRCVSITELVSV